MSDPTYCRTCDHVLALCPHNPHEELAQQLRQESGYAIITCRMAANVAQGNPELARQQLSVAEKFRFKN